MTCRFRQSNFRKSSLDDFGCATPVLSPGIARAAVWVGLGAVAWSRGIGWRSGVAAVLGVKTGMFSKIHLDITTTTTTTEQQCTINVFRCIPPCASHQRDQFLLLLPVITVHSECSCTMVSGDGRVSHK